MPFMRKLSSPFRLFRARPRGRLVRDYFLISVVLVGGGLISSGLVEIYFRYQESREQLAIYQHEVATGAAFKIERFVQEIHNTLKGATRSREIAPKGLTPEFRFELEKLLLIAPAVTEAVALDENGAVRVQASRLRTVLPDANKDLSKEPSFRQAKGGKPYFGPVHFVRGSEPYMTIAVPIERFAGDVIGVLQAEVNLKYIGDVVSSITVGKAGYAYAVTRSGELIAHPDISLVLQRRNVASLEQVKAVFAGDAARRPNAIVAANLKGEKVFSSFALIPTLDWAVILERPIQEAYEPLYASMLRTSTLLLIGLGMALLASYFVARRVIRPLATLREGVERIGSGDLSHRLQVKTGDEIEALAQEFNKMTAQLQESYAGLEQKVEERTKELTEALEQQTATGEILRVIASSPTDIQPVLDAVAQNAARLCEASDARIRLAEGDGTKLVASFGSNPAPDFLPNTLGNVAGRVVLQRQTIHIPDLMKSDEFPESKGLLEHTGTRAILGTPLLREGTPIGVIMIRRTDARPFSEKQVALLKTFADQAVIAIENVRLFQEIQEKNRDLTESLEQQTATGEVLRVIAGSPTDVQPVLDTVIENAVRLAGAKQGHIRQSDGEFLQLVATYGETAEQVAILRANPTRLSQEHAGSSRAFLERRVRHVLDAQAEPQPAPQALLTGARTLLAVPLLREGNPIGTITIWRDVVEPFTERQIELVKTFADQAVIAIENVRLFQEIQEKNQQLETASRHKSQFLANMSHELRTPLNAIIGFTRLVLRKTEGQIAPLQKDNLQKVLVSSEHLLNLINGVLDLSKVEAGRMEVFAETFKLDEIVRVAVATVEPMLKDGRVRLVTELAPEMPSLHTDRDKLKQSLLNLLSNAAKFTEKGQIKVSAWPENGSLKLVVSDTGIGMTPDALKVIFDEFRQADMSTTRKYGGTGLGLALVKKFVELMGGAIVAESEAGKGSKFIMTLPIEFEAKS